MARIPELENFVCALRPRPLFEEDLEIEMPNEVKELVRDWPVPENLRDIENLGNEELSRLMLLIWIMQQAPEDRSRDLGTIDSVARATLGRRAAEAAYAIECAKQEAAEQLLALLCRDNAGS